MFPFLRMNNSIHFLDGVVVLPPPQQKISYPLTTFLNKTINFTILLMNTRKHTTPTTSVATKTYSYTTGSNLLSSMDVGGAFTHSYVYDANGNVIKEDTARFMEWDYADRLRSFYVRPATSSPYSQYVQYLYDGAGNRIRKITWKQGGLTQITTYIDGIFDKYEENSGSNCNYYVGGGARIRTGSPLSDPMPDIIYNLSDHLNSVGVTVSITGSMLNKEEYYAFGETSFGSYAKKRYRFGGKERDEESGFYYYGARYYLAYLCRFLSVDPMAGKRPTFNSYHYCSDNPINRVDPTGMVDEGGGDNNGKKDSGNIIDKTFSKELANGTKIFAKEKGKIDAVGDHFEVHAAIGYKITSGESNFGNVNFLDASFNTINDAQNALKSFENSAFDDIKKDVNSANLTKSIENKQKDGLVNNGLPQKEPDESHVVDMVFDAILIAAGTVAVITAVALLSASVPLTGGASILPIAGLITGLYGMAAGSVKLGEEVTGNHEVAENIPDSYTGALLSPAGKKAESIGNVAELGLGPWKGSFRVLKNPKLFNELNTLEKTELILYPPTIYSSLSGLNNNLKK